MKNQKRSDSLKRKKDGYRLLISLAFLIAAWVYLYTKNYLFAFLIFIVPFALSIAFSICKKLLIKRKYIRSGICDVDKMEGEEFEKFLLCHFEAQGYKGKTTPKSNDYGADLILSKDNEKMVLQAKRWTAKVGIAAVQQIAGAVNYYKADKGIVITNNYFTKNAVNLADKNNIELWDRNKLIEIMSKSVNRTASKKALHHDSCPLCGGTMVKKTGKYGTFYGCSNYPSCKHTE